MGGHSHAEGHHGHHDHHHHAPRINKSLISYEIPDPGHHVDDFKAPDWRKHQVKNAPELVKVQKRLAVLGLKDPWLRNEVWRYDPQFGAVPARTLLIRNATTTLKLGLALAAGVILLETGYNKLFKKGDDHHHGHAHH